MKKEGVRGGGEEGKTFEQFGKRRREEMDH